MSFSTLLFSIDQTVLKIAFALFIILIVLSIIKKAIKMAIVFGICLILAFGIHAGSKVLLENNNIKVEASTLYIDGKPLDISEIDHVSTEASGENLGLTIQLKDGTNQNISIPVDSQKAIEYVFKTLKIKVN